ncbi:ribokinase [Rhodotorula toruloides NP11]|uniref:Ribokinase n=1 Tax=Rhodotorula toruloides (strain NP11) TaxID=1130832 RepID=M7WZA8_RHOT1|nr:ribokinase [Rhodotorula toruloides NP11]EMS23165.1 ribokinase [Rhodotorula toruloides NP11]
MPDTPEKLIVRGSVNIDEFFVVDHIVRSGETISSTDYSRRAGGKGANQAVAAAKAGAEVDFAGLVGNDGGWLRDTLGGYGVGTSLLGADETLPTGRAVIQLSSSTADNSIVLLPGANFSQISPLHDLTSAQLSTYSHILLQNEIPLQETKGALRRAKSAGLTTLFNPSPMPSRQALTEFEWQHLDWLVINEGEGADLLAALADPTATESSGGAAALLGALRRTALGSLTGIIMTRGADGVVSSLRDGSVVEVGPGKVVGGVKDTTGAGDCFTGYFATLLSTLPRSPDFALTPAKLRDVLAIASQAAAICVESPGAMESVPTLAAVKERMGDGWKEGMEWEALLR